MLLRCVCVIAAPQRSDSTSHFFHAKTPEVPRSNQGPNANTHHTPTRMVSIITKTFVRYLWCTSAKAAKIELVCLFVYKMRTKNFVLHQNKINVVVRFIVNISFEIYWSFLN